MTMMRLSELTKDYYSTGEVSRMLNLNPKTAYFWCRRGTVNFFRLPGGDYAIPKFEVIRLLKERGLAAEEKQRKDIIYVQIPTKENPEDLDPEIAYVLFKALPYKLFEPEVIQDVKGQKAKPKGLGKLSKMAANHEVGRIFILSKDCLSTFGFDYLKAYFDLCGTQIIVVNDKPSQEEEIKHLLHMTNVLCDRLHGISAQQKETLRQQVDSL